MSGSPIILNPVLTMKLLILVSLIFSVSFSSKALAEWVSVTGSSKIVEKNYVKAREMARNDAFQQAIEYFGAKVSSQQRVENGVLKNDYLAISSDARIRKSVVEDQYERQGKLYLKMRIDVEDIPVCPDSQSSKYKKKVAIMGFSVENARSQRLGGLSNIERGLASSINQVLMSQDMLLVYENSNNSLYQELVNAPSHFTGQNTLTKAANLAKELGVQFVISGVIRELDLEDPDAFSTSVWSRFKRASGASNLNRRFSVELFVHDGYSGAIVWQRLFSLSAPWDTDFNEPVGFASAEFWQLEYGKAVRELIDGVSLLLGEQLKCQPFMTRISRIEGKTMHFSSGAASGIRPGDKLSLYRTFNYYDSDLLTGTELTNVKTVLTVSQVHPNFATGKISIDPGRINIQEDDLLIAW